MSDKIITEIVLEGEKEAIASIQRVGKAADATFADLQNVQLNFDFIEPQKGLKSLTDAGQRFASSMKNTGNIVTNVFAGITSAFRNAGTVGGGVFSELTRSLQATSLMAKTAGVQIPSLGRTVSALGRTVDSFSGGVRTAAMNTTAFGQAVAATGPKLSGSALAAYNLGRNIGDVGVTAVRVATQIVKLVTVVSLLGTATIAAFGALAKSASTAINAVGEAARNASMSVDAYDKLMIAMNGLGISSEDAQAAITAMSAQLARFGIRYGPDSAGVADMLSNNFARLADQVAFNIDPVKQLQIAQAALGAELGKKLLPQLRMGGDYFRQLADDSRIAGIAFNKLDDSNATRFIVAWSRLSTIISQLKNKIGAQFAEPFANAINTVTELLLQNAQSILQWGVDLAAATGPVLVDLARAFAGLDNKVENKNILAFRDAIFGIGKAIGFAVQTVVGGFKLIVAAVKPAADAVNNLFGIQITAGEVVAYAAILQLIGAFRLLFLVATGIGALASPWTLVVVAIGAVLIALGYLAYKYWPEIKQAVADATQWMKDKFGDAWTVVAGAAATAAIAGIITLIGLIPGALAGAVAGIAAFGSAVAAAIVAAPWVALGIAIAGVAAALGVLAYEYWPQIKAAAEATWAAIKSGAATLWADIQAAWNAGVSALNSLWQLLVSSAQSAWSLITQGASTLWAGLQSVWSSGVAAVSALWSGLTTGAQTAWDTLVAGAKGAASAINTLFANIIDYLFGNQLAGDLQAALPLWDQMAGAAESAMSRINAAVASATAAVNQLSAALQQAAATARAAQSAMQEVAAGGGAAGYARGGSIRGPGASTSDSVLLWGSRGEFMQPARAVRHYGLAFMEAVRTLRLPIPHFATGGLIDGLSNALMSPLAPALAMPQPAPVTASPSRILNLTIGNETFSGLAADEDTMERLTRFAVRQQLRSSGRKPGWNR
jgi:hypothetical protein